MRSLNCTDEMRLSGLLPAGGGLLYVAGAWIGPGLGPDLVITEMHPPPSMVGRTLAELDLPRKMGITVVGVRTGETKVDLPRPQLPLSAGDVLIVVSRPGAAAALMDGGDK